MQVVSGSLRGLKLDSIKNDIVRPTKDRIKKSLFDIVRFRIQNKVFLDLFGGSGQIGIEAFSQGANKVIIVESDKENLNIIKKNVSRIKNNKEIYIYHSDAVKFLKNSNLKLDIAFLDPPYSDKELLEKCFIKIENLKFIPEMIITETLSSQNIPSKTEKFYLYKRYIYGKISLNLYEKINLI